MTKKYTNYNVNGDRYYINRFDYTPIIMILGYIYFTYTLHLIINNNNSVFGFVFMCIVGATILLGYLLPKFKSSVWSPSTTLITKWKYRRKVDFLIILCSLVTIGYCLNFITSYYKGISDILFYAINPGKAYEYIKMIKKYPELNNVNGGFGSVISILLTLSAGTKYIFITLSLLYWKKIKTITKLISVLAIGIYILYSLLVGSMIAIASLFLACFPIFIFHFRDNNSIFLNKWKVITSTLLISSLVFFFINNRTTGEGIETILFYITHGYVGLEYALKLPFEFTYGFTTFKGITSYFVDYLGVTNYINNSYPFRNETVNGWPALSVWSTIFPWLASDFSFALIPFILFFISYKFSMLWNKTRGTKNPYGFLLLGQIFIFWFMIPANNQLFHTFENSMAFILILIIYKISKYKIVWRDKRS
ncbi:hypothetical protein [Halobacillus litoralis]|uniref:hypothetical protein n=1 Tax=Halobacillus litoralis TaxID=45668 RepID=UPI001CD4D724|nr:hypothetical protein [Halobacillus litoralis]MCA1021064.1 hypothetical protein [Halobacillus litoralis]